MKLTCPVKEKVIKRRSNLSTEICRTGFAAYQERKDIERTERLKKIGKHAHEVYLPNLIDAHTLALSSKPMSKRSNTTKSLYSHVND